MPVLDTKRIDELEAKRGQMNSKQAASLDRIQTRRQAVPASYLERLGAMADSGQYDPVKHEEGLVGDFISSALRFDMQGHTAETALEAMGIKTTRKEFANRIIQQAQGLQQIDAFLELPEAEQRKQSLASLVQEARAHEVAASVSGPLGGMIPAGKSRTVSEADISEKAVGKRHSKDVQEAIYKSPKALHQWAAQNLSPSNEKIAWAVAMSQDPEKTALFWQDSIEGMGDEQRSYAMQLISAANPEIDAGSMKRLGLAFWNPTKGIGTGVGTWMKQQGWDLFTYYDNTREWSNRLEKEFSSDELATLWGAGGAVNPDLEKRYGKVVAKAANEGGLQDGAQADPRIREKSKARRNTYLENGQVLYRDGADYRKKEKLRYDVEQATAPRYQDLGALETPLAVVEGAVYMGELFAISAIPVVGQAVAGGIMYAQAQSEWERRLINEYDADPVSASVISSGFAVAYAAVERLQIKGLDPQTWKPFIGSQSGKKIMANALGQWFSRGARQTGVETAEEWIQGGTEFAMMATAKAYADAEGIDLGKEAERAVSEAWEAAKMMPGIMALGGAGIRGAVSAKTAVQEKSFKKGVGAFTPDEFKQAAADMSAAPDVFEAEQQGRKVMAALDEKGVEELGNLPASDLEFYQMNHDAQAFGSLESGKTYSSIDEWMLEKGYNPDTDKVKFETAIELNEANTAKRKAHFARLIEIQQASERNPDTVPLVGASGDPKFSGVDYAADRYGAGLGLETQVFETEADAAKAFPDVDWKGKNGAMIGDTVVMISANIPNHIEATRVWMEEALGHKGIAMNPRQKEILSSLRETLGDDFIQAMLPEYAELYTQNETFADEYLAKIISRMDIDKATQELEGAGRMDRVKNWLKDAMEVRGAGEAKGRKVLELAREVMGAAMERSDPQADLYPEGATVKMDGKTFTRKGGAWATTSGGKISNPDLVAEIEKRADASAYTTERVGTRERNKAVKEQINTEASQDSVVSEILQNGGIRMPERKRGEAYSDEYEAVPEMFRGGQAKSNPNAKFIAGFTGKTDSEGLPIDEAVLTVNEALSSDPMGASAGTESFDEDGLIEHLAKFAGHAQDLRDGTRLTDDEQTDAEAAAFERAGGSFEAGDAVDDPFDGDDIPFSVAPAPDTPAFKKWFGDSKVVDSEGNPLVVYHGTKTDFDAFSLDAERRNGMLHGKGFYFTANSSKAGVYTKSAGGNIMPVYLRLQNPYMGFESLSSDQQRTLLNADGDFSDILSSMGFDGRIVVDGHEIMVFSPTQIKSATGNVGTFDAQNPDIRFSVADDVLSPDDAARHKDYEERFFSPQEEFSDDEMDDFLALDKKVSNELRLRREREETSKRKRLKAAGLPDDYRGVTYPGQGERGGVSDFRRSPKRQELLGIVQGRERLEKVVDTGFTRIYKVRHADRPDGVEFFEPMVWNQAGSWNRIYLPYASTLEEAQDMAGHSHNFYAWDQRNSNVESNAGIQNGYSYEAIVDEPDPSASKKRAAEKRIEEFGDVPADQAHESPLRFSLAGRNDTESLAARLLAMEVVRGVSVADPKAVKALYKKLGVDTPEKAVLTQIIEESKTLAAIGRRELSERRRGDDRELSRLINTEADKQLIRRKMAEAERMGEKGGSDYEATIAELKEMARLQADVLKQSRKGLTAGELAEKYNINLSLTDLDLVEEIPEPRKKSEKTPPKVGTGTGDGDTSQNGKKEAVRQPVEEKLYEIAHAVVRKLNEDGMLTGMNISKAMRKPWVLAEYRKTLQNIARDKVMEFNHGASRDILMERIAKLDELSTLKGLDFRMFGIMDYANKTRTRQGKQELIDEVFELTGSFKGRIKYRTQDVRRKVAARWETMFAGIRKVVLLTPEEVQERVAELTAKVNDPKALGEGDSSALRRDADLLGVLMKFGGLEYKTLADAAGAVEWLKENLEEQMQAQEVRLAKAKAEAEGTRSMISQTLKPGRRGYNEKHALETFNTQNMMLEMRMEQMVRLGAGQSKDDALKAVRELAFEVARANFRKNNEVAQDNQALGEALQGIYGITKANINKTLRDLMTPRDELMEFSKNNVALSKAQVLQILATLSQSQYRASALVMRELEQAIKAQGLDLGADTQVLVSALTQTPGEYIHWRSADGAHELNAYQLQQFVKGVKQGAPMLRRLEQEDAMIDALSEQDLKVLDWMRNFYDEKRAELSKVNEDITGFFIDNPDPLYMPVKMDFETQAIKSVMLSMPVVPASLSPRVFHSRDLDESADVFSLFQQRLESNGQFVNFAPIYQKVAMAFNDPKLINDLKRTHGEAFVNGLFRHLRDVMANRSLEGSSNAVIDKLTNYFAVTRLGFNMSLLPKQITSLPAFAMYVDFKGWAKYTSSALTAEGIETMKEIAHSPHATTRMRTGFTQVMNDMLGMVDGKGEINKVGRAGNLWDWYKVNGMVFTKYGDIIPTLIFGQGYYRAMLDDAAKQGMRTQEAKEWAMDQLWRVVEMSQQSGSMMNRAEWQRGDSYGRAIGQFISTPQQFMSKQIHDFRMFQGSIEAGDKEGIRQGAKQVTKDVVINAMLAASYSGMRILWNGLLGSWPDDEKDAQQFIVSVLAGPFSSMFVIGGVIEGFLTGVIAGEKGYGGQILPIAGLTTDAQTFGAALNMMATGDMDGFWQAIDSLVSSQIAPYRDVSKAVKNYSE